MVVSAVAARRRLIGFVLLSAVISRPTTTPSSFRIRKATLFLSEYFLASPWPARSTDCGTSKSVRGLVGTIISFSVNLQTSCWLGVAASRLGSDSAGQKLALALGCGIIDLPRGEVGP